MARPAGRNSADTRRSLLDAAARLFADNGYAGTSIREIADAANLQSAMIAYYFKNKAGLYGAVIDQMYGRLDQVFTTNVGNFLPLLSNLEQLSQIAWYFADANRHSMRILIQDSLVMHQDRARGSRGPRMDVLKKIATELARIVEIDYKEARTLTLTFNYYITRLISEREEALRDLWDVGPDDPFAPAAAAEIQRFLQLLLNQINHLRDKDPIGQ